LAGLTTAANRKAEDGDRAIAILPAQLHLPLATRVVPAMHRQLPSSWQKPWSELMVGSALQVWSCPGVHAPGMPTHPRVASKQLPEGHRQVLTAWLSAGAQPHGPGAH